MRNSTYLKFLTLIFSFFLFANISAQVTPIDANSDAECGPDCWDLFTWSPVEDGTGTDIPNYAEGVAQDANCFTTISGSVEYIGNDPNGIDDTGTLIGANQQGTSPWTDEWTFSFSDALTNPVYNFNALFSDSQVCLTDCNGAPITVTEIGNGTSYPSGCFMGNANVQLIGTFDCVIVTIENDKNDAYTIGVGTCLSANIPPPCTTCAVGTDYEYLSLTNATGTGTGATADVEIDGVLYGSATVVYSDLSINEDLSGTSFGAFANGNTTDETMILSVELCEPITIQQVDVLGLETESQVWVGSSLSGTGPTAMPTGMTLTQCGGSVNMMSTGNMITNTAASCANQGNGNYTVGGVTVSTLYFRYTNPIGGCVFDKATFRIGLCVPDGSDAIPVCPLTYLTYATDIDDYVTNGPDFIGSDANAFQVMVDGNGNYFDMNCTTIANDVMDVDANGDGDLLDEGDIDADGDGNIDAGNTLSTTMISPCAELVDIEDCSFCDPPPPCTDCTTGSFQLIDLDQTGMNVAGLPVGIIEVNGVCIGQYEFEFSDLDVNLDGNGTKFGGFDNDGGSMCLRIDFCEAQVVQQLDVINLEVGSMISVGTNKTGTGAAASLSGLTLTHCDGSDRMDADDITNGNTVTTAGPGCGANPNASYTVGTPLVSTLYFTYTNPAGNCSYDYVGFQLGICYETDPVYAVPVCPIEIYDIACTDPLGNQIGNQTVAVDAAGNIFQDYTTAGNVQNITSCLDDFVIDDTFMGQLSLQDAIDTSTPLLTADLGCAEIVGFSDTECVIDGCTTEPVCSMCPTDNTYEYLTLDQTGTTAGGLDMGIVELNNVKIGTFEFLFSDLDVSTDGNGSTFGGFDNDGGTMLLELDLCEPITIAELQVINLEVESMVSLGTTLIGTGATATLGGMILTHCDGSDRMDADDITNGNTITTAGPGCGANPNATYITTPATVSTLYFKYQNPTGGCSFDYVGFRIGACVEPFEDMILPQCSIALYEVDNCPEDATSPTFTYMQDGNGNWFDMACPLTLPTAQLQAIQLSPCASVTYLEDCPICVIPGLAKTISNVTNASSGIAGNVDVTFKFTLTNLGGSAMGNLVINDNLTGIPGYVGQVGIPIGMISANPSGTAMLPTVNSSYNGTGNILNGTTGSLTDGDEIMIFVTAEFDASEIPDTLNNMAEGGGSPPGGMIILDDAVAGITPDPDGDGDPSNNGGGAPLYIPSINLAKEFTSIIPSSSGTLGNYDVTVQLVIENTGNVPMINLTLIDDLNTQLTGSFVDVVITPMIIASTATTDPDIEASYNGNTVTNLFNGTSGYLEPGEMITVSFVMEVNPNGSTTFLTDNQATAGGKAVDPAGNPIMNPDGSMVLVSDDSDAGNDPDSDNGDGIGDTGGSDDPSILQIPEISITKDCSDIQQTACRPAGNVDVTYQLYVMNTGNTDITDIVLQDDLLSEFGTALVTVNSATISSTSATMSPVINNGYDGSTDIDLFNGTTGLLEPNQMVVVTIVVEFDPNAAGAPMIGFNQANASASSVDFLDNMVVVSDLSDSGTDPNTNNIGEPNNSDVVGTSEVANDPTPFPMPNINSANELVDVGPSPSGVSGQITATYRLYIENTGNVNLEDLCAIEELTAPNQFGGAFVGVVNTPTIVSSTATSNPNINGDYDGLTSTNFFNGSSGLLEPGDGLVIEYTIELNPFATNGQQSLCNQVTVKGTGLGCDGVDIVVTDMSDAGNEPEGENTDVVLGGNLCSSDCTPFSSCFEQACTQLVCNDHINLSAGPDCLVNLTADMILEGIDPECTGSGFPSFYDVLILDDSGNPLPTDDTYGGITFDASELVGQTITVEVISVCNSYTCGTTITIEDKITPELNCDCETPYLADGVTPNPDCTFSCFEVSDLEILEEPGRNNELLPDADDMVPDDNCIDFGFPTYNITYSEGPNCGEEIVTRELLWTYTDFNGEVQYLSCTQNFLFDNLDITSIGATVNGAWDGYPDVFTANAGDRPMQSIYTPEQVVYLSCGADVSPAGIAAAYDIDTPGRPTGIDRDDHSQTPNLVEHNEGYAYAYPYVVQGGWAGRFHAKPIDNNICNIYTVFTDLIYDTCAEDCFGNSKVARSWTILDWCTATTVEFVQTIKRIDQEGPAVSAPDVTLSVDPWSCTADYIVPAPEHLMDNCDKDPTWTVATAPGITYINGTLVGLEKGITQFTYEASDCCGNVNSWTVNVLVEDKTAPTAIALSNIVVGLINDQDGEGIAKLYAVDVDNESNDGCSDVHFEIRRPDANGEWCATGSSTFNNDGHEGDHPDDPDGGEYVKFCCEDILSVDDNGVSYGMIDVILRVWDDGDMDGVYGSEGDNYNETWTTVRVEDKQAPVVVCPTHIELSCNEDYLDYELTGRPYAFKTCEAVDCEAEPSDNFRRKPANSPPFVGEEIAAYNPSCRRGAIQRTWSCEGKTCTQWIIMRDTEDGELEIIWPEDQTSDCLGFESGEPDVVELLCELTGTSLQSDTFYFEDGACYKILNHWSVINWCDYDAADPDLNEEIDDEDDGIIPGLYTHTQELKLIDTEKPSLTLQDTCFAVNADCIGEGISIWAGGEDNGICASAWLKWEVEVDMNSDWVVDYTYSSWYAPEDDFYLAPTGGDVHVNLPNGLSNGCSSKHRVRWSVSDGCGNDTQGTSFFTIEDKKKPTPYMVNLSTALMEDGSVELWAKDFNAGSFDNCSPEDFLLYTFSSNVPYQLLDASEEDPWYDADGAASENDYNNGNAEIWIAEDNSSGMVFDAQDLADAEANGGLFEQAVYVWDLCGNFDYTIVNIKLVDNGGDASANISGRVATESGVGVEGVTMSATSEQVGYPASAITIDNGEYMFQYNPMYNDYTLEGEKNDDWLNGVSTLDVVLIQRHILGLTTLDSPYKMIAADANNDERISAVDLIQLRKLILGLYAELPNNDSWRFTDADASMNPTSPWPFTEFVDVVDLQSDMDEDFIGVKIGDVNGSVEETLIGASTENRNRASLNFNVEQIKLEQGITELRFSSNNFDDIAGFQFTLESNASEIVGLSSGLLVVDDYNLNIKNGALVMSWNTDTLSSYGKGTLFTIKLIKEEGNNLIISNKIAKSEAYQGAGLETINVSLGEGNDIIETLSQNNPNPWKTETTINFRLTKAGSANLKVYDVTGKIIYTNEAVYREGTNQIVLNRKDLGSVSGVLYYKLESGEFSATRKMILID